ncbi:hypothetical protein KIW84_025343 [Lathyrus oleraceus]|uniref:MULE transposase domain-containing protein n=2 Tax=Pisum sativum TaxID=3888 RepID=A0A9D5BDI1_PEA|nr:hypothetical protein KIW84_025343 [Pisum sativum]
MENLPKICVDTTDAFMTTKRFGTREEVIRWIREVGIDNKVTVIISRSDTETGKRGRSNKIIFGCDKGGKHKISDSGTQSASKKCGCPFKIRSTPAKDGSGWKIDVKCGLHNHGLPDRLEGHSFIGRLTTDEKQHVADLAKRHVAPRNILLSLQDKFPENVTRITQVYKHKSVIEKEIRGPRSEIQHLFKLIEDARYVYWSRKKDDSEVVREIFWAHPNSVKLLNIFPIVLVMDNTYKTNKYRQPLFEIVGMTSTELTFAVGFAYMESEQTENFCWVLEKLKELFVKKDMCPQVILTDRDLALMKAIEVVFPNSINLLCRFHINKNVGRYKVGGIPIPIDVVHVHWRKLTMEVELEIGEDDGSKVDMTAAMDELWRRFRSLDVVGKRALRSRVCELAYPTMTTLCPPPEKIKTKGGVKKKGKKPADYDVYRDPSYHEYVDKASQSSQRQSQPSQTSKKIKLSKKQPQFIVQFPNHIRSYIEDVVNVESDGNCGFRVIASLHGYGEDGWSMVRRELGLELIDKDRSTLYDKLFSNRLSAVRESLMIESFGSQPPEKWMSLPDMGYLIANRYNVVLVCLGNPCITFFPMTSSHSPNVSIYCIGFVNQNHWVQVNMKEGFPLPPVTLDWKKFRSHITTTWMLGFAGRMQHWQLLTPVIA